VQERPDNSPDVTYAMEPAEAMPVPQVVVVQQPRPPSIAPDRKSRFVSGLGVIVALGTIANVAIGLARTASTFVTSDGIKPTLDDVAKLRSDRDAHTLMLSELRVRMSSLEQECRKK
jgi:hypothetical protein